MTLSNGTVSYEGLYGELVSQVGTKTNELQVTSQAQTNMVTQTSQAQQAVSGVNLDEEAANLIRYQQAYQAASKAIQIASTLFDSVLSISK
jgi:flagellar hook-associated protein 1 FlgK